MYPVFTASHHIHLSSYLMWMSLTFCICVYYFYKRAFRTSLSAKIAADLSIWIMVGGFIGARAFHILLEFPEFYRDHPSEIFLFWKGGFVFYGGLFGGLFSAYIFLKRKHQSFTPWLDHAAPVIALGYAIGRIGCLLAGCCYGKECDLPWAIQFKQGVEAPAFIYLHPTQIYSFLIELIIFFVLLKSQSLDWVKTQSGRLFSLWLMLHGLGRVVVEHFRADFRGNEYMGLSISTYFSLAIILSGFLFICSTLKKTRSKI